MLAVVIVALFALWLLWPREWHKRSTVKRRTKGKARPRSRKSRNSRTSMKRKQRSRR